MFNIFNIFNIFKIGYHVYPSPTLSTSTVEPYNGLLTMHWLNDHEQITIPMDNEQLYEICQKRLDIPVPTYNQLNRLIAKNISFWTASLRFKGELNYDWSAFLINLIPFPRLHFITTAMEPVYTPEKYKTFPNTLEAITYRAFDPNSFWIKIADYDPEEDKYMVCD